MESPKIAEFRKEYDYFVLLIRRWFEACDDTLACGIENNVVSVVDLQRKIYHEIKAKYQLPSALMSRIIMCCWKELRVSSCPNIQNVYDTPLLFEPGNYKVEYFNSDYFKLILKITGITPEGQQTTSVYIPYTDKQSKEIVRGLLCKRYKKGTLLIFQKGSAWYITLMPMYPKHMKIHEEIAVDVELKLPSTLVTTYESSEVQELAKNVRSSIISKYRRFLKKKGGRKATVYMEVKVNVDQINVLPEQTLEKVK